MIVVDTSVWVSVLRGGSAAPAQTLITLLDADEVALPLPVRLELSAGVAKSDRTPLRRALSALPVLAPSDATWALMEQWVERAAGQGQRFGVSDLLIGALAEEIGAVVWSLDADFQRMEKAGFVHLYS